MRKKTVEIPVSGVAVKAAMLDTKPNSAEEEAGFADFGTILKDSRITQRSTEVRTFVIKDKTLKFEIYTDGAEDAEVWAGLLAALQWGYIMQVAAKASGQPFNGIDIIIPLADGVKEFTVKDPAYIGNVKVLSLVLKRPAWSFDECLMMGHELGRGFYAVCEWAARANGVTEHFNAELRELEKNAPNLSR